MSKNIEVDTKTGYDQPYQDEKVLEIEHKLGALTPDLEDEFINTLAIKIDDENPGWFSRLIEYVQIIFPLKKEESRTISLETKTILLRLIFGIFQDRDQQFELLNKISPLYTFKYSEEVINYFVNESRVRSYKKFVIYLHPENNYAFPSKDFTILIHEVAHSLNASIPLQLVEKIKKEDRKTFVRIHDYSPIICFLREYLSDMSAMLLTDKENANVTFHVPISTRIMDRIGNSLSIYPTLEKYVQKNGWKDFDNLIHLIPYNLVSVVDISNKLQTIVLDYCKNAVKNLSEHAVYPQESKDLYILLLNF